jgi:hypothetical protein
VIAFPIIVIVWCHRFKGSIITLILPMESSREISIPTVAKRLGCTIPYAQTLVRTGRIPGRKTARGWVTTIAVVKEYLAKRAGVPARPEVQMKSRLE